MKNEKKFLALALSVLALTSSCDAFATSNGNEYAPERQQAKENVLNGKTLYFLGSSVTLGMRSKECAIPDYLSAIDGMNCVKDAVSGTTLISEEEGDSYYARLVHSDRFDKNARIDAFVLQLSTNDAQPDRIEKWGTITADDVFSSDAFDIHTTYGAIESILAYVEKTWDCPIYIYTNAYFGDEGLRSIGNTKGSDYAKLVDGAKEIVAKYDGKEGYEVRLVDLFNDEAFNDISDDDYRFYMADAIHPYRTGYLYWWTPYFEKVLLEDFAEEEKV